jgi:hypothetical protein
MACCRLQPQYKEKEKDDWESKLLGKKGEQLVLFLLVQLAAHFIPQFFILQRFILQLGSPGTHL